MEIVRETISLQRLRAMAEERFGDLVKAVVDIEREVMAVDAGMHADEEAVLLEDGSEQAALWGINLYPGEYGNPAQGNRTRSVDDPATRSRIAQIVGKLVAS